MNDLCTRVERFVGMALFTVLHSGFDERFKQFFFETVHPLMLGG